MAESFSATLGLDRPEYKNCNIAVLEQGSADSSFVLTCIMWEWLVGKSTRASRAEGALLPRASEPTSAVFLVSSHHSLSHYRIQSLKLGLNLPSFKQRGAFESLEIMSLICDALHAPNLESEIFQENSGIILKNLYLLIRTHILRISKRYKSICLVIGNIDDLLIAGQTASDIVVFLNYLQALQNEVDNLSLVISAHVSNHEEHSNVIEAYLKHSSDLSLTISGLQTGLCKDISGSISVTSVISSSRSYHYRLLDRQVKIFAPGST